MKRNQSFSPGLASHHHPSIPQIILIIFLGGAEKGLLQGQERRQVAHIPKSFKLSDGFQESILTFLI